MVLEYDLSSILTSAVRTILGAHVYDDETKMDLELLDLAVDG